MNPLPAQRKVTRIRDRFRGFLPVVVDVETAGFDPHRSALLQVAACILRMDEAGDLYVGETLSADIYPFEGADINPDALKFNGIEDPYTPLRGAIEERQALEALFQPIRREIKATGCTRAILVGHNAFFDLNFIQAAAERTGVKSPFHKFSTFDTVTLAGLIYGQTVLAKAVKAAGIPWDQRQAHGARYDTEKTAELFCHIVNRHPLYLPAETDTDHG